MSRAALRVGPAPGPAAASAARRAPQPGHAIGTANDAFEREADAVAQGMDAAGTAGSTRPPRPTRIAAPPPTRVAQRDEEGGEDPHGVDAVLRQPGEALDAAHRARFQTRLGADFTQVRLHRGASAARSAQALGAQAYTVGRHIVLGSDVPALHLREGRHLLAHELAHVAQQAGLRDGTQPIQRRTPSDAPAATPAALWYQEAVDEMTLDQQRADAQRKSGSWVFLPNHETRVALLALCKAVDAGLKDEVPGRIDMLLKTGLWVHLQILSRALLTELTARIHELGLEADAERLRSAYAKQELSDAYGNDPYASRRQLAFLARLTEGAVAAGRHATPEDLASSIHRYARAWVRLRDAYAAIDFAALEHERQQRYGAIVFRPGMSHEEHYRAIVEQARRWLVGFSTLAQSVMDGARADLEAGGQRGAALLGALRRGMATEIREVIFGAAGVATGLNAEAFAITQTAMDKGRGSIGDAFATDPKSAEAKRRRVSVNTYTPGQDDVQELRATPADFYRTRMAQLHVLGNIYGVLDALTPAAGFAENMQAAEAAKDNAASVAKLPGGRMRLDSDDDWRAFLLQRYEDMTTPPAATAQAPQPVARFTPAQALHAIIDLLFDYLQAFTVHARFTNVYDAGDVNYLNRPFPRTLEGQAVHDCGVYALRVAYMLSLIRDRLGLTFRFIVMPAHISLAITNDGALPTFLVENDHVSEITPQELAARRKTFEQYRDPATGQAPPGSSDEAQFIGEQATADFIHGPVDMPFSVQAVPPPVGSAKAQQAALWAAYQKTAATELFGKPSHDKNDPNHLFERRYLALTEEYRQIHNETILPFWNVAAPAAWEAFQHTLAGGGAPRATVTVDEMMNALGVYRLAYEAALAPVKARYERYYATERDLGQRLRADPQLLKAGISVSQGARALAASHWQFYWDLHQKRLQDYDVALLEREGGAPESIDAASRTLDPPFAPRPDKSLSPLN